MLSSAQWPDLTGYPSRFQGGQVCTRYWYEFYPRYEIQFVIPHVDIGLRTEIIFPNLRAIISLYLFNNTDRFRSGTNNSV